MLRTSKRQISKKVNIVHVTTVHNRSDIRIFKKELCTLAGFFDSVTLIVNDSKGNDFVHGVHIIDLDVKINSRFQRIFKPMFRLIRAVLREKPDVVHFHDPELLFVGVFFAIFGIKVIYDSHEDLAKQMLEKEWLSRFMVLRKFYSWAFSAIERLSVPFFAAVIFVVDTQLLKIKAKKSIILKNYAIAKSFNSSKNSFSSKCSNKYFIYVGTMTEHRGIREMLDAMVDLPEPYYLIIVGPFSRGAREIAFNHSSWPRVHYIEWLEGDELVYLMKNAIAGLMLLYPTPNMYNSSPNKLYEYMASSIPVIASDFPCFEDVVVRCNCGILVDPRDCGAIYSAMKRFIDDPKIRDEMGRNGVSAVLSDYNWESESSKLVDLYYEVISSHGGRVR